MKATRLDDEDVLMAEVARLAGRYAHAMVDSDAADDVAQEVAFAMLQRLRRGQPLWQGARLRGLVRQATRHRALDRFRRERRRGEREERYARERSERRPAWMSPEAAYDDAQLRLFRDRILYELPERCRRAYVMVREEHATYESAARELVMSRSAVCAYVVTAQRTFRRRLAEIGIKPGRRREQAGRRI